MNLDFLKKPKTLFILGVGVILFAIIVTLLPSSTALPILVSSDPVDGATNVATTLPITFTYSSTILPSNFQISSTPEEDWSFEQTSENILLVKHSKYLQLNTAYVLTIKYNGKNLGTLSFKTVAGPADPRYYQNIQSELDRDYPLAKHVPYYSTSYYIVYSAPLTLEITLRDKTIAPSQAISDIKAWVTSVGGDSMAHKYVIGTGPIPSPATFQTTPTASTPTPVPSASSPSLFEYAPAE